MAVSSQQQQQQHVTGRASWLPASCGGQQTMPVSTSAASVSFAVLSQNVRLTGTTTLWDTYARHVTSNIRSMVHARAGVNPA
jgi:hypothetical protein